MGEEEERVQMVIRVKGNLFFLVIITTTEIPGQTTRKTTTQKLPDLQNHIEDKPPFSASNYKKGSLRPTPPPAGEQFHRSHQSTTAVGFQNSSKTNARPTKSSIENILKQTATGYGSAENSGSRQTHLIRSASQEEEEAIRAIFGNKGQLLAPGMRVICWALVVVVGMMGVMIG